MDWDNLRYFAALAAGGSLSAAARVLDVEHATVARRIAALEAELDLKLVDRRARRLTLTPDGERIAAIAARMEQETQAARRTASGARATLSGTVTISAPPALAAALLAPPLVALRDKHPSLAIHLHGELRDASLDRREADIALRLSRPTAGDLTIRKIAEMVFRFYAAPNYLKAAKRKERRYIGYNGAMQQSPLQRLVDRSGGSKPSGFASPMLEIHQALARAGAGIALLPDFMAANDKALVAVKGTETLTRDLWLVTHTDMSRSAPIRVVTQALTQWFEAPERLMR